MKTRSIISSLACLLLSITFSSAAHSQTTFPTEYGTFEFSNGFSGSYTKTITWSGYTNTSDCEYVATDGKKAMEYVYTTFFDGTKTTLYVRSDFDGSQFSRTTYSQNNSNEITGTYEWRPAGKPSSSGRVKETTKSSDDLMSDITTRVYIDNSGAFYACGIVVSPSANAWNQNPIVTTTTLIEADASNSQITKSLKYHY